MISNLNTYKKIGFVLVYLVYFFLKVRRAVVAHALNPSTRGTEADICLELKVTLVYRVSSRTAKVTQRNAVSERKKTEQTNKYSE